MCLRSFCVLSCDLSDECVVFCFGFVCVCGCFYVLCLRLFCVFSRGGSDPRAVDLRIHWRERRGWWRQVKGDQLRHRDKGGGERGRVQEEGGRGKAARHACWLYSSTAGGNGLRLTCCGRGRRAPLQHSAVTSGHPEAYLAMLAPALDGVIRMVR